MKKVIVTGHSKGLGHALAQELLEQGNHVLGISRSASGITGREKLQELPLDLSDPAAVETLVVEGTLADFLQNATEALLINNAGIVDPIATAGRQAPDVIARAVALNVSAPLVLTNAFLAVTGNVKDRRVMHISSGAARNAFAGWSVYCATKAALDHHARCLVEDDIANLKVCSLAPGIVDTSMQATIRSTLKEDFPLLERFQDFKSDGVLSSPEQTAHAMIAYMQSNQYGNEVCADIRNL